MAYPRNRETLSALPRMAQTGRNQSGKASRRRLLSSWKEQVIEETRKENQGVW